MDNINLRYPLLDILIPTFNRPDQLLDCLSSISTQLHDNSIAIIVIDDSESDVNRDVISSVSNHMQNFTYIKNSKNLGIDNNIEKCLNSGNGSYVLILGEDDVLLPNAISYIKNILECNAIDILYNSYVYLDNSKKNVIGFPLNVRGYIEPIDFIEEHLWAIGFVGSVVIRRNYINKVKKTYLGTYFNHVGRIVINMNNLTRIYASPFPLVGNRSDDLSSSTWSSKFYDVLFGFEDLLMQLANESEFNKSFYIALIKLRKKFKYTYLVRLAYMRSYGIYNKSIYLAYRRSGKPPAFGLFAFLIAFLPQFLFLPIRFTFNFARKLKRIFTHPSIILDGND